MTLSRIGDTGENRARQIKMADKQNPEIVVSAALG
tara:strand:- start:183 stop:287 length:105 start_codon:yes stop_codon:yes gene_type:complete